MRIMQALILLAAVTAASSMVRAGSEQGHLDELMEKSGLSRQLNEIAPNISLQLRSRHPDLYTAKFEQAVNTAYAPGKLRSAVRKVLGGAVSSEGMEEVHRWLSSPLGRRITALEEEASTPEAYGEMQKKRAYFENGIGKGRIENLELLDKAASITEVSVAIAVNTALAVAEGATSAAPEGPRIPVEVLEAAIHAQRDSIFAAIHREVILFMAFTYRDLNDAELAEYIEFAESPAAREYHRVTSEALERVLTEAARELGKLLGMRIQAA